METEQNQENKFTEFCRIIEVLFGENGCPWDKEQTYESLKGSFLEECYEVIDAIDTGDLKGIQEELGDVLLHVVMYSKIAEHEDSFNINDVIQTIQEKIIYRHPHVFSDTKVDNKNEILQSWDSLKAKEKGYQSDSEKLNKIPKALPALTRATKIQKNAAKIFPIPYDAQTMINHVIEELELLKTSINSNNEQLFEEFGDLIFKIVAISGLLQINPEFALTKSSETFINRFENAENKLFLAKSSCEQLSVKEKNHESGELWK